MAVARAQLDGGAGVHFVIDPTPEQLADLYNIADVFVTASTSHFETFGRAPAEALACGSPAVAPSYDGFTEVLAQPGGTLVDVEVDPVTGPHVSEEHLLRAVYDVLSSPRPPRRQDVAATARRRFGRSTTIGLLDHLIGGDTGRRRAAVPSASIELPGEWRRPLAELAGGEALDALSWFWNGCDHDRFGAHDDEFAAQVRRVLCVPALGVEDVVAACP